MLRNRHSPPVGRNASSVPRGQTAASSAPRKTPGSRCRRMGSMPRVPAEALHRAAAAVLAGKGQPLRPGEGGDENRLIPRPQNQALPLRMVPEGQHPVSPAERAVPCQLRSRQGRFPMAQGQNAVPLPGGKAVGQVRFPALGQSQEGGGVGGSQVLPPSGGPWQQKERRPLSHGLRDLPGGPWASRESSPSASETFFASSSRARAFRASSSRRRVSAARRMLPTAWGLMLSSTGRTWWRRRFRAGPSLPLLSSSTWGMAWSSA